MTNILDKILKDKNMGVYQIKSDGIYKNDFRICPTPIIPTLIYENIETGNSQIELTYQLSPQEGLKKVIVNSDTLAISNKIITLATKRIKIDSNNCKEMINFFKDYQELNYNLIPIKLSISRLGWMDDIFIPYDQKIEFDGYADQKSTFDSIKEVGNFSEWKELVSNLRKNVVIKLLMATTLASPLLKILHLKPYIFNLWSVNSGNGKTIASMVAMSIWGNPNSGCLQFGTNNTTQFYVRTANFLQDITMFCDELQCYNTNVNASLKSLVMELSEGIERGRSNREGKIFQPKTWNNNFLFTNNEPLAKQDYPEQVFNRIIDIQYDDVLIAYPREVLSIINKNYGTAGKIFINYIKTLGMDVINDRYYEIFDFLKQNTKLSSKHITIWAVLLLANEFGRECIFKEEQQIELSELELYLVDSDERSTWKLAMNTIINQINLNINSFNSNNEYGKFWGKIDSSIVTINKEICVELLRKSGYDFDSIKKDWAKNGFLIKNASGKFSHQIKILGIQGNYVKLNLDIIK